MSQAILVLAHKNFQQVFDLTKCLSPYFKVYVHFDKKKKLSVEQCQRFKSSSINIFQQFSVNWGAWSICETMLFLMKEALKDPDISYFHFISGQDYPVIHPNDIAKYYENKNNIFMNFSLAKGMRKTGEPLLWWQQYYFDYDKVQRQSYGGILYHRLSLLSQTIRRVNKFKELNISIPIYQGSQWIDLPRDAAKYVIDYLYSHDNVKKMLETGFCSDEFMFQTVLCNSIFSSRIVNENHRFILLKKQHNSVPAILDESNFSQIIASDAHFARKIDSNISKALIRKLKNNTH